MNNKTVKVAILIFVLLGGIAGGFYYWHQQQLFPSTDDAYVNANIINIAPQINGPVSQVYVQNYQLVQKNQPLFDIDPQPFIIAVQQAAAALKLAEQNVASQIAAVNAAAAAVTESRNELILASENAGRILPLVRGGQLPKSEGDSVTEKLNVAKAALQAAEQNLEQAKQQLGDPGENNAQIASAKAALAQANLNLSYTHIIAPATGRLINFTARTGDMLIAGVQLFSLIEQNEWWVEANFKETQLRHMRIGQLATITVDTYPDHYFKGVIVDISQGSGAAFSLLPAENATGNWVKVTQRFSVKIKITDVDPNYPLRVGASADVTVDTTGNNANNHG